MKSKNLVLIVACLLMQTISFSQTKQQPIVGSDMDAHGCKASAGYTFSKVKNNCVRLFEEPVQLKELNPKESYTSNCTIIFSKDQRKAEVFIPNEKTSVILLRSGKSGSYCWKKGVYALYKKNGYSLNKSANTIFKSDEKVR